MSARSALAGAVLAAGMMLAIGAALSLSACSSATQPAPATSEYYAHASEKKQEILELWMQIRKWRVEGLALRPNPHRTEIATVFRASVGRLRICPKQPKPKTPKCSDVCTIKDAICDNAQDICRIADEIPRDAWARDKCNSAKASCKEARKRCCGCIAEEPQEGATLPAPF